jgi:predicted LPLAT superfamily acyltransferase
VSRRPNIERPVRLEVYLPISLRGRLDLHLWSEAEGRVPKGAYSTLLAHLLTDYLNRLEHPHVQSSNSRAHQTPT